MAQDEQVLVIRRDALEQTGMFQGLAFDVTPRLERLFAPGTACFMPRANAEQDPAYKQLIPYVILRCGDRTLSYVRGKRGGESRLVGNRSIGIGGHINPIDELALFSDLRETYLNAVQREVEEEIHVQANYTDRIVALINDDSNAVGSVHLGVVHLWTLDSEAVEKREQMITQMGFLSTDELQAVRDTMETWSQLCLDGLLVK
ncbi:MAG: hypothetical protein GX298_09765 [Planctomycetes bacterium]|jgi:predicted NUDIX family phosphoesterase|nr:hypothetical protein [Planctomycetota bacterium]